MVTASRRRATVEILWRRRRVDGDGVTLSGDGGNSLATAARRWVPSSHPFWRAGLADLGGMPRLVPAHELDPLIEIERPERGMGADEPAQRKPIASQDYRLEVPPRLLESGPRRRLVELRPGQDGLAGHDLAAAVEHDFQVHRGG